MYAVLIIVHAVAGVVALVAGCLVLRAPSVFPVYFWSVSVMAFALAGAVALDWSDVDTTTRLVFSALLALGAFVVWRALQARGSRPAGGARPSGRHLDHLGFTLVALLDGFLVVAMLDLSAPAWLVGAVGVFVAVAGHFAIAAVKRRVAVGNRPGLTASSGPVRFSWHLAGDPSSDEERSTEF